MIVVVQLRFLPFVVSGVAVRTVTGTLLAAPYVIVRGPFDVVRHQQVEPAILVVIEPARAGRPSAVVNDTGFRSDIGESSIAIVVIEN